MPFNPRSTSKSGRRNGNFKDTSKEVDDVGCDTIGCPKLRPNKAFTQFRNIHVHEPLHLHVHHDKSSMKLKAWF